MTPLLFRPRPTRRGDRGFTLIEILVAIVLVGVLAGVAVIGVNALTGSGSSSACTSSADAARAASAAYYAAHGTHPTDLGSLAAGPTPLLAAPPGATVGAQSIATEDWTLTMTVAANGPAFTCGRAGGSTPTTMSLLPTPTTITPTTVPPTSAVVPTTSAPTTTTTTTTTPTTIAPTTTVATLPAGVSATGTTSGDGRYFLEWDLRLANQAPISSMRLTITIAHDGTWRHHGAWADLWGGIWTVTSTQSAGALTYQFDLVPGQSIVAGSWTLAAQADGTGTSHPVSGDRWTLSVTTSAGSGTRSGTFS